MDSASSVDTSATPSDSRAPLSTRDSTSRPSESLPSRNHGSSDENVTRRERSSS